MKVKSITLIVACALISQVHAESPGQLAESLYRQGQVAEKAGDPVAAKNFYARALKADPRNANAIYSLGQLKVTSGTIAAKGREAKFGGVMIPLFQLDQASLQEALAALGQIIEKQSNPAVAPNFLIQDPQNVLAAKKISLNLKNTPSQAVLSYLLEQAGAKARFDEYAIVITPR